MKRFTSKHEWFLRLYTSDGAVHIVRARGGSLAANVCRAVTELKTQGLKVDADYLGNDMKFEWELSERLDALEAKALEKIAS